MRKCKDAVDTAMHPHRHLVIDEHG